MPRLSHVIAREAKARSIAAGAFKDAMNRANDRAGYDGRVRTYRPMEDSDGTAARPSEIQHPRQTAKGVLMAMQEDMNEWLDLMATRDVGNTHATADVTIGKDVIIKDAPTTLLLALERAVADWETLIESLPIRASDQKWNPAPDLGLFISDPVESLSMKRQVVPLVLHQGTDKHPPQTTTTEVEIPAGTWRSELHSGALAPSEKAALLTRVRALLAAINAAREEANTRIVDDQQIGVALTGFVFGDLR